MDTATKNWYDDRANLTTVARQMAAAGDSAEDVAYMLEKPWKFEDEWNRAVAQGGTDA